MSVYKDKRSPYFSFDFWIHGRRFLGSTKARTRREAEKVEATEREKARAVIAQTKAARTSLRLDDIAGRYWTDHAQYLAWAPNTWCHLKWLIEFHGKDKLITDFVDDDVARQVAWRRGHLGPSGRLVSPFSVNHTTATLRKLFTRCKLW